MSTLPNPLTKTHHIHLVSDSTGETVKSMVRACLVQFKNYGSVIEHEWILVRSEQRLEEVLKGIKAAPGPVLFTLVDYHLSQKLEKACRHLRIPVVPLMEQPLKALSSWFKEPVSSRPGSQHVMDESYFGRIDAMNFAFLHDDGQLPARLHEADVVLVGPSRTSKTPTAIYLANRGIKVANVPFVPNTPLPDDLEKLNNALIIGLIKNPKRLVEIRRSRQEKLDKNMQTLYTDLEEIRKEILSIRQLCTKNKWPIIDVSHRSIEETAAKIIDILNKKHESNTV